MAIAVTDDVVGALTEDIAGRIASIAAVKKTGLPIYSPEQILTVQQRLSLPAVVYHYAGMQKQEKYHKVVFFIYLVAQAQSVTATKGSKVITEATAILQELRKAMGCSKSVTHMAWVLDSEIPDLAEGDKLIYRQRWSTGYHISN